MSSETTRRKGVGVLRSGLEPGSLGVEELEGAGVTGLLSDPLAGVALEAGASSSEEEEEEEEEES